MRIIGIDPGFGRLGIAIIDYEAGKETFVHSECFETDKKESFQVRLQQIGKKIAQVCEEWRPESCGIESLFFEKNQKTAMAVSEARGVIVYELLCHNVTVFDYTPLQVKIALTGFGKAEKEQVAFMVTKILGIESKGRIDDELDALALAITHGASHKRQM